MEKKKKSNPIFGILLLAVLLAGIGFLVFMYWPWKSLSGEVRKELGGSGELMAVAVEKVSGSILSLEPDSPEAKAIVQEIENTKVMFLRTEVGMASFSSFYVVQLRLKDSHGMIDGYTAVEIKDNGDLHISTADHTYRVTSKDSKLFEMLREAYNKAAKK